MLVLVTLVPLWALTIVRVPEAQPAEKVPVIGLLGPDEEPRFSRLAEGVRHGLRDQGYPTSGFELLEARVKRGDPESAREASTGLIRKGAAVLFVIGSEITRAAREAGPQTHRADHMVN